MRKPVILITGANGEMGHGLIHSLFEKTETDILALDLEPLSKNIKHHVLDGVQGDILDVKLLEMLNTEYEIKAIYHLAALLSTRAEFSPMIAHDVNVNGTLNLLKLAMEQAQSQGEKVKFFFPSSIAVYGINSLDEKNNAGAILETEFLSPQTMYGCNKLYCEQLGTYFSNHYQQLSATYSPGLLDFRSIRFPGLISAITMPTGGTSDFIPEMLHNAVQGKPYNSFVDSETAIPFMTMPDAIRAILELMATPQKNLIRNVYHISAFAPTAGEFKTVIGTYFKNANLGFDVNEKRQKIVNSWPKEVDDSSAKNDWNWKPEHNLESALENYLVPGVKEFYNKK
jgi:threonine 3-dehydrogenase